MRSRDALKGISRIKIGRTMDGERLQTMEGCLPQQRRFFMTASRLTPLLQNQPFPRHAAQ